MPHLSDGDLHAWLDGAIAGASDEGASLRVHLETCADCAFRLEEARELKAQSGSILSSAVPREAAPPFEQIRENALADTTDVGGKSGLRRLRGPWLSAQRLGWAASVALALGAGWIGRAVLEEKGWTDPFHERPPPVASRVADGEVDAEEPPEYFARELETPEEKAGQVGGRVSGREAANETGADRQAALKDEGAPSAVLGEVRKRDLDDRAPADPQAATPRRTGALAQTEELRAEDAAVAAAGDVSAADEIAAAPSEAERQDARAKSVQATMDPWHALPEVGISAAAVGAAGCYRLEYSWSPGVANLPGALELATAEAEGRTGQSVFEVLSRGGRTSDLREAIWASSHPDSVWVQLVLGDAGAVFTVRAGRSGPDWEGEGRVHRPGGPVSVGQARGAVRLVRIGCDPP